MQPSDKRLPHKTTDKIFSRQDLEEAVKQERERIKDEVEDIVLSQTGWALHKLGGEWDAFWEKELGE